MNPGDLVARVNWEGKLTLVGLLLEVRVDQKLAKNRWDIPWVYRVLWQDGITKEHEVGTLRRLAVHR